MPLGNCEVAFATSCPAAGTVGSASSHTLCRSFPAESLNQEKMEHLSWHIGGLIWKGGRKNPLLCLHLFFSPPSCSSEAVNRDFFFSIVFNPQPCPVPALIIP